MEIFGKSQPEPPDLQRPDCLLKRFFVRFTDTHYFADRTHLGTQSILGITEFLKRPASKLDDYVIAGRCIFF